MPAAKVAYSPRIRPTTPAPSGTRPSAPPRWRISVNSSPGPAAVSQQSTASRVQLAQQLAVAAAGHRLLRVHVDAAQGGGRDEREGVHLRLQRAQRRDQPAPSRAPSHARVRPSITASPSPTMAPSTITTERPRRKSGQLRQRREVHDAGGRGGRLGRRPRPLEPGGEHLGRALGRPQHHPGVDLAHVVEAELHRGDDAEVPAAAAERPEEVGLLVGRGPDEAPVGGDELDRRHAVGRQAVLAAEPAQAAAERVADDAHVGRGARQRREADHGGLRGDLQPQRAGGDARDLRVRVDLHAAHALGAEEDHVVERAAAAPRCAPCPAAPRAGRGRGRSRRWPRRRPRRPGRRRAPGAGRARGSRRAGRGRTPCRRGRRRRRPGPPRGSRRRPPGSRCSACGSVTSPCSEWPGLRCRTRYSGTWPPAAPGQAPHPEGGYPTERPTARTSGVSAALSRSRRTWRSMPPAANVSEECWIAVPSATCMTSSSSSTAVVVVDAERAPDPLAAGQQLGLHARHGEGHGDAEAEQDVEHHPARVERAAQRRRVRAAPPRGARRRA